jgi:DNA (cytosine-5)-methyltransferase 1
MSARRLKVLSLFTGIGGLDLGYEKAGFDVVATVEWDRDCCETLSLNQRKFFSPSTKIIQADITKIQPEDIYDGKIDFFIGGPPCQTFSAIGRRAGGAAGRLDDRGNLFKHYCRLLNHYKPAGFMFENVRGILSSNKGQDWRDIIKEFSSLGYKLKYRVLDTAGYGAAQHRERVILVGYRSDTEFFFPRPTHGPDSGSKKEYVTPGSILEKIDHMEDVTTLFNQGGKYDHLLEGVPPGSNYLFYTEEMGHPQPKFAWRSKFSDFLYKAHPEQPVKTIVASMGRYSGPFHWSGRKMSVGELLRLQGFPVGFELAGGRSSKIKQIGNSVVPVFAYPLAQAVKATVFKDNDIKINLLSDADNLHIDRRKGLKARATKGNRVQFANSDQLSLIPNEERVETPLIILKSARYFLEYKQPTQMKLERKRTLGTEFYLDIKTKKDVALVKLEQSELVQKELVPVVEIEIAVNSSAVGGIKKIKLESVWYDTQRPYVFWDAINVAVGSISPLPSIHELYGHFTEPNPKFSITKFNIPEDGEPVSRLLKWMSNFNNTFSTHPLSVLRGMGFDVRNERRLLTTLRENRIDIRTNLTNKRIGKGEFRVCYPYTLPIDRRTFVTIQ